MTSKVVSKRDFMHIRVWGNWLSCGKRSGCIYETMVLWIRRLSCLLDGITLRMFLVHICKDSLL